MNWIARLVATGLGVEMAVAGVAFASGGSPALAAALAGGGVALGAQVAAVVVLRPAMSAQGPVFNRRWALGVAARAASFLMVAVLILTFDDALPPVWTAMGYLAVLLSLLFAETRFLR